MSLNLKIEIIKIFKLELEFSSDFRKKKEEDVKESVPSKQPPATK